LEQLPEQQVPLVLQLLPVLLQQLPFWQACVAEHVETHVPLLLLHVRHWLALHEHGSVGL
jgi:hypothetical protein